MEEEGEEFRAPPYWLPSSDSFRHTDSSSSFSFSSGTGFVVLLLAATVAIIPSLSSVSSRPQSVNSSWDYLNLLLVFFAILCGFLNRNSNGACDSSSSYAATLKSNSSTPRCSSFDLMRSSSSDPDLRHESLDSPTDDRRRFFDDIQIYRSRRWTEEEELEERSRYGYSDFHTTIHVDIVEVHSQEVRNESPPTPPSPPPPPPPSQLYGFYYEQKMDNSEKRGGSALTKDFLTAFRKKKKKQREKSAESFDIDMLFDSSDPPLPPPPPPFKVPDWEFVMRGEYVRIKSANASGRSWPDPIDDTEEGTQSGGNSPSTSSVASTGASEATSLALLCRSPDVNTKADNFIASFWAGLQLEKANSIRRRTELNLGSDPIPDPGPAL